MACRIGITTDLVKRLSYWENQYPRTIRNWQIVNTCYSKSEAQLSETRLAATWGCQAHADGEAPDEPENSIWYVYYFEHNGE